MAKGMKSGPKMKSSKSLGGITRSPMAGGAVFTGKK